MDESGTPSSHSTPALPGLSFLADANASFFDLNQVSPSFTPALPSLTPYMASSRKRKAFVPETPASPTKMNFPTPLPLPKRRRRALRVIKKLHYETMPNCYLVEWEETGRKNYRAWQTEGQETKGCRKLIAEFNQKLAEDPKLAKEMSEYQVEAILDRTVLGELHYLVQWVGWHTPSWEKEHWLSAEYSWLLADFDAINEVEANGEAQEKKKKGGRKRKRPAGEEEEEEAANEAKSIEKEEMKPSRKKEYPKWVKRPEKAPQALEVLSKLDLGNSGQPPRYLLRWPPGTAKRTEEILPVPENSSWEWHISVGNQHVIDQFEKSLKRGQKAAKQRVTFQVEKVLDRKFRKASQTVEYLVKWLGFDRRRDWMSLADLVPPFGYLIEQYEKAWVQKQAKKQSKLSHLFDDDWTEEAEEEFWQTGQRLMNCL